MSLLQIQNLTKSFGGLTAVRDVSFAIPERSIFGLIGPNGSGKTITFDCITGFQRPEAGRVLFQGKEITGLKPYEIALRGIGRSFQITGIFPNLTVRENMVFAVQEKMIFRNFRIGLKTARWRSSQDGGQKIDQMLKFTGLNGVRDEAVGQLPHGLQKILEIGSLMLMNPDPALYLLDEPFSGLTQDEVSRYLSLIRELQRRGKTFLIVEHNMKAIMNVCDRVVVLDYGEKIAEGAPQEIQKNPKVIEAYLGTSS